MGVQHSHISDQLAEPVMEVRFSVRTPTELESQPFVAEPPLQRVRPTQKRSQRPQRSTPPFSPITHRMLVSPRRTPRSAMHERRPVSCLTSIRPKSRRAQVYGHDDDVALAHESTHAVLPAQPSASPAASSRPPGLPRSPHPSKAHHAHSPHSPAAPAHAVVSPSRAVAASPLVLLPGAAGVGAGGHGSVVVGLLNHSYVAVKKLPVCDPQTSVELAAFAAVSAAGGHVNVLASHAPALSPDGAHLHLPLQLCDTDLLAYTDAKGGLEEDEAAHFFNQIIDGLLYLQSCSLSHMDVKPENVFLSNRVVKLGDLGCVVARRTHVDGLPGTLHPCGTEMYACPEAVAHLHVPAADVIGAGAQRPHVQPCAFAPASSASSSHTRAQTLMTSASGAGGRAGAVCVPAPPSSPTLAELATISPTSSCWGGWALPGGAKPSPPPSRRDDVTAPSPLCVCTCAPLPPVHTERADVWALGVSLFVLVTGYFPFGQAHDSNSRYRAWAGSFAGSAQQQRREEEYTTVRVFGRLQSQRGTPFSRELVDVLRRALDPDVTLRASLRELKAHPFLTRRALGASGASSSSSSGSGSSSSRGVAHSPSSGSGKAASASAPTSPTTSSRRMGDVSNASRHKRTGVPVSSCLPLPGCGSDVTPHSPATSRPVSSVSLASSASAVSVHRRI